MKRCILHLGLAKTGTTSVQNFLFANRATLLERWRILYPGHESNHFHFQTMFADHPANLIQVRRMGISSEEEARSFAKRYREAFEDELGRTRPDTLMISSEYFASMDEGELARLRDYLHSLAQDTQLLVFVRDPWSFATSDAQQRLRDRLHQGPLDFTYGYYVVLVRRFEAVFGTKAEVRPYIRLGSTRTDAIAQTCEALGIERSLLQETDRQDNPAIGYTTAAILSVINEVDPALGSDGTLKIDPVRNVYVNAILKNATDRSTIRLSPHAARAIRAEAADDLSWLRDRYFGGVCPFQLAYEAHDFEGGQDSISIDQISRHDIVAVLVSALRDLSDLYIVNQDWGKSLYSETLVTAADAERRKGSTARARELLEEALQMWPQNVRAQEALAQLSQSGPPTSGGGPP